jgi:hypothetical protein
LLDPALQVVIFDFPFKLIHAVFQLSHVYVTSVRDWFVLGYKLQPTDLKVKLSTRGSIAVCGCGGGRRTRAERG